ncbi:acyl-CoA dehydrogenase family protein [Bradyrhizobium brasilense]|uniref:acyl-CoA dehydrogenase family protein n=1 Tax=Bradyrhizobium brasilense TaxID=1419277 RepID=UPI0024B0E6F5|nr:acyl-CoA dehydrogenase family protein [Bradyrhizobium australafricanum]WFU31357.1 acyl-CoA dehydrogenase family protein [Bradyrhizobium australafricanum]
MYELKEETRAIVELVRRIVRDHQMPLEAQMLRGEKLTFADYQPGREAARQAGLWGLRLPSEFGGADLSLVDRLAVVEENRKCLTPIRFGGEVLPSLIHVQGEQKARYLDPFLSDSTAICFALTEPGGGSDPAGALSTHARRDEKGWVINGSKIWITDFDNADRVFVFARTGKERAANNISTFAVEKGNPGLIARPVPMLGVGHVTHQLAFEDCRVDDVACIGAEGAGFKSAQDALNPVRFEIAATALGIAQRCYEMMVEHAKQRVAFGGPLSEKQSIQSMIVDSWVEIQQIRLLMYTCAEKHDRGEDARIEAGMLKMVGSEMVGRVVDRAIQIHGAAGCTYETPLAHWYDNQRMARIYDGASEVLKHRVLARYLLT